jgi:hypothetical protein
MHNNFRIIALIASLLGSSCVIGCSSQQSSAFISASIRQDEGEDAFGNQMIRTMTTKDAITIRHLASFFPGMADGRSSIRSGGWIANVVIMFTRADGSSIRVGTNYEAWGAQGAGGTGEFPVAPGFKAYVDQLIESSPNVASENVATRP